MLLVCSTLLGYLSPPAEAEAAKEEPVQRSRSARGGRTFSGDQTRTIPANRVGNRIRVDGRYIEFNVRSRNFATLSYRHNTGVATPHPRRG